jgi:hypothetical protein
MIRIWSFNCWARSKSARTHQLYPLPQTRYCSLPLAPRKVKDSSVAAGAGDTCMHSCLVGRSTQTQSQINQLHRHAYDGPWAHGRGYVLSKSCTGHDTTCRSLLLLGIRVSNVWHRNFRLWCIRFYGFTQSDTVDPFFQHFHHFSIYVWFWITKCKYDSNIN